MPADRRGFFGWAPLLALMALLLALSSCAGSNVAAVVNGREIAATELDSLRPEGSEVVAEDQAASLFLLVFQQLLVTNAEEEFGLTVSQARVEAAFAERTGGSEESLDQLLAGRGTTRERVLVEAELDVIREELEEEFIRRGGPGVDLDAAYRQFISSNSLACLVMLAPTSPEVVPEIEAAVEAGATINEVQAELPDMVERVDLGCASPLQHPVAVQSVAVDGEIDKAYVEAFSDGTVYVVGVTERDAPAKDDVADEVIELAARSQGRDLFDAWAIELLRAAEVEIDGSFGSWGPTPDTNEIPTVLAPS